MYSSPYTLWRPKRKYSKNLDFETSVDLKRAALKASPSVVSVVSRIGKKVFFPCSGILIDCEDIGDGTYVGSILTSASLLSRNSCIIPQYHCSDIGDDIVPDDIKVRVRLGDGRLLKAQVVGHDLHLNIALLKVQSDAPLPTAKVRLLDDSICIDPNENRTPAGSESFQLLPHSDLYKIHHGDAVVTLARHFLKPYDFGCFSGTLRLYSSYDKWDCKDLFTADCRNYRCGVGGPLINRYGEVIGVNFFCDQESTPFLPTNIVFKCLEHFKKFGKFCRPSYGMDLFNLHSAHMSLLGKLFQKFPNTFKGVIVDKVREESPADRAGILVNDVIIQCNGSSVQSLLEFKGMLYDKVGESVELVVLRASSGTRLNISMTVDETGPDELNRWQVPRPARGPAKFYNKGKRKRELFHCCGKTTISWRLSGSPGNWTAI